MYRCIRCARHHTGVCGIPPILKERAVSKGAAEEPRRDATAPVRSRSPSGLWRGHHSPDLAVEMALDEVRARRDVLIGRLRGIPQGETYDQALNALDELEAQWQELLQGGVSKRS